MSIHDQLSKFIHDESGDSFVTWTLLTTGMAVLSIAVLSSVGSGTVSMADKSRDYVENAPIGSSHAGSGTRKASKVEPEKAATGNTREAAKKRADTKKAAKKAAREAAKKKAAAKKAARRAAREVRRKKSGVVRNSGVGPV